MQNQSITCFLLSVAACTYAQTPEQELEKCIKRSIEKYQYLQDYSQTFRCSVDNKKPFKDPPHSGPTAVQIDRPGYAFLEANSRVLLKISDGGHTPPFISPNKSRVTSSIWCQAENKDFGKSGKYDFEIYGRVQRVATKIEYRRVLQECSSNTEKLFVKSN